MNNHNTASGFLFTLAPGAIVLFCASAVTAFAEPTRSPLSPTNIFAPVSTPARAIFDLSRFVLMIAAAVFVVVFGLLAYAVMKFRKNKFMDSREPAQVYGSTQVELAWTVIPILIVVVLFLAAARVIGSIQNAARPDNAIEVTVIGHQFWWEFRYPSLKVVTANELHIPVSDPAHPVPTFLTLLSADTDHSFWVPFPPQWHSPVRIPDRQTPSTSSKRRERASELSVSRFSPYDFEWMAGAFPAKPAVGELVYLSRLARSMA